MIKLVIKNKDGSVYWTEHFNNHGDCDQWLNEEKTRKYWKKEFTTEVVDMTPLPPTKEELDERQAKQERIQALRDKHAAMKPSDIDTIVEMRQALFELHQILGIK